MKVIASSPSRIRADIERLSQYTATPEAGVTRLSYSDEDKSAREYVIHAMEELGMHVRVDGIGNIIGRFSDDTGSAVAIGSHLDSVPHGGAYDGAAGVVAGLEIARLLKDNDVQLTVPFEVIVFVEEEGTSFGSSLLGSRAMAGLIDDPAQFVDGAGQSITEAARKFGLTGELADTVRPPGSVSHFFELHIEQGPYLEQLGKPIGIVTNIMGIYQAEVEFTGQSGHAGAFPMYLRSDPLIASFHALTALRQYWLERSDSNVTFTVGSLRTEPGAANVIPERVMATIDVRDAGVDKRDQMLQQFPLRLQEDAGKEGVEVAYREKVDIPSVKLSHSLAEQLAVTANELQIPMHRLVSGATHDTVSMNHICDQTAMVFVQSRNGYSHRPDEYSDAEHIALGVDVIVNTILARWALKS